MFCPDRLFELTQSRAAQSFSNISFVMASGCFEGAPGSLLERRSVLERKASAGEPQSQPRLQTSSSCSGIGFVFESIFRCAQQTTTLFLQVLRMRFARFSPHSHPPVSMTDPQCPLFCCAPRRHRCTRRPRRPSR